MIIRPLFLLLSLASITACTLYKSSGREAIEKDQGGILPFYIQGFEPKTFPKSGLFYSCSQSPQLPEELNQPLQVITPESIEKLQFDIYVLDEPSAFETFRQVFIHRHDETIGVHSLCRVSYLKSIEENTLKDRASAQKVAASFGIDFIQTHLLNRTF